MMNAKIKAIAEKYGVNGNFCATVAGRELFSVDSGYCDIEAQLPYSGDTLTYVASVTKQFTAVCIMMLQEKGLIDIDDTLDKYVPEYYLANRVTLRQLLNMTSGIPNQLSVIGERLRKRRGEFDMGDADFERMVSRAMAPEKCTLKDFLEIVNAEPMIFEPGEKFDYSDTNYTLLGETVSRISGISYAEFMKQNIFAPLGMDTTVVGAAYSDGPSYSVYDGKLCNMGRAYFTTGEGSICTTARQLCKWLNAVLEGRFISKESWNQCFTMVNGYGFGWHKSGSWYNHGGGDLGYSSLVAIHPEKKVTFAGAMNMNCAGFYDEVLSAIKQELNIDD